MYEAFEQNASFSSAECGCSVFCFGCSYEERFQKEEEEKKAAEEQEKKDMMASNDAAKSSAVNPFAGATPGLTSFSQAFSAAAASAAASAAAAAAAAAAAIPSGISLPKATAMFSDTIGAAPPNSSAKAATVSKTVGATSADAKGDPLKDDAGTGDADIDALLMDALGDDTAGEDLSCLLLVSYRSLHDKEWLVVV